MLSIEVACFIFAREKLKVSSLARESCFNAVLVAGAECGLVRSRVFFFPSDAAPDPDPDPDPNQLLSRSLAKNKVSTSSLDDDHCIGIVYGLYMDCIWGVYE